MRPRLLIALPILLGLAACHDDERDAAIPAPQEVSDSSVGQFCGMALTEHPGPKGQIFVHGQPKPFWFASVHDAVAFSMLPEMPKNLAAIYVTDMARAQDWAQPEAGTWIEARKAVYVIGSSRKGGMDANEAVPFGDDEAARRFASVNGGKVVRFAEIPRSYILDASTDGS
jgi:copper chaperone NosL